MPTTRRASRTSVPMSIAAFCLGACATVAVQGVASDTGTAPAADSAQAPEAAGATDAAGATGAATVVALEDAPERVAPSGKARVKHLARGSNAYLGRLEMDAGAAVPVHRDATEEFIFVLEGAGTITIDGQAHSLDAGSSVYMPADAEVSYQNGDAPMVAVQVFAGPEPAAKYEAWKSPG